MDDQNDPLKDDELEAEEDEDEPEGDMGEDKGTF